MTRLDPALLEQIKARVSISEVAALYVTADKRKSKPGDLWACCPFPGHAEKTPSFHAEDARGRAHCYGCGEDVDHFEFVERMDRVSFRDAVAKVASMAGIQIEGGGEVRDLPPRPVREAAPDPYAGYTFIPAPHDAPAIIPGKKSPPLRNPKKQREDGSPWVTHYTPEDVYPYYNADGELIGYDLRVIIKGEKLTPTILWAKWDGGEGWCHGRLPKMPLLGLPELLANPGKQVLVVEGGKCQKAAAAALAGRVVVVSWCGGTNGLEKVDWKPLSGRSLLLWPDHDEGGYKAMHEVAKRAKPSRAKWVRSYDKEKGADVADLIADGGDVAAYIKANISETPLEWQKEKGDDNRNVDIPGNGDSTDISVLEDRHNKEGTGATDAHDSGSRASEQDPRGQHERGIGRDNGVGDLEVDQAIDADWQSHLQFTDKGLDKSSMLNVTLFLQYDDIFKDIFRLNDFSKQIWLMRKPPWESKWTGKRMLKDTDVTAVAGFMETVGLKPKRNDMGAVIERVAEFNRFNPVVESLDALVWDGKPRLQGGISGSQTFPHMCLRYFGVEATEIHKAFFEKTMIGTVARAYEPGCKHDTVLILEGPQGKLKSTAIEAMCDAVSHGVYTDQVSDPSSKDAGLDIQGRWIVELSELDAFRRADVSQIKAWLSRKTDRFRRPYGKVTEEFPRSCVFWGSVNPPPNGYLKDRTGARRFWPVYISEAVDIEILRQDAAQLWAEAVALYKAGAKWWLTEEEESMAKPIQMARMEGDPWAGLIEDFVTEKTDAIRTTVKVSDIMGSGCLGIPAERRAPYHADRIEAHLTMMGWLKVNNGVYRRP